MNLLYDLDGVLRWLTAVPRDWHEPASWDEPLPNGQSILEFFGEKLERLCYAPVTEYYSTMVKDRRQRMTILTHQPEEWIPYTDKWIHVYIPNAEVIYVNSFEEKMKYINEETLLVDDYPKFKDNSKIVIIDRPYNKNVKDCYIRIKSPEEFDTFRKEIEIEKELDKLLYVGGQKCVL